MNDNKFTNWDDYWLVNFERLNIFFEHLYSIKGLSTNSITSYKDDFKNMVNILNTIFQNSKPDKIIYETFKSKDDTLKSFLTESDFIKDICKSGKHFLSFFITSLPYLLSSEITKKVFKPFD